jgi:hypothetical protein
MELQRRRTRRRRGGAYYVTPFCAVHWTLPLLKSQIPVYQNHAS